MRVFLEKKLALMEIPAQFNCLHRLKQSLPVTVLPLILPPLVSGRMGNQ